jgi:hypothetical protein
VTILPGNLHRVHPVACLQTILLCLYRLTQLKECTTLNSIYWFHNMFRLFFGHYQVNTTVYQMLFWIVTILLLIWAHIHNNCCGGQLYWHRIHRIFLDFFHRHVFQKTRRFGNWICFRPQVKVGEKTHTQLGPLERDKNTAFRKRSVSVLRWRWGRRHLLSSRWKVVDRGWWTDNQSFDGPNLRRYEAEFESVGGKPKHR